MKSWHSSLFSRLQIIVFFYLWGVQLSRGDEVNVTMDDTDPSIRYEPPESWHASSTVCMGCLNPDLRNAYLGTYHDGTHVLSKDEDEVKEAVESESSHKGNPRSKQPRRHSRATRLDADAPGFVDKNVTAEFYFTGTAVYLYCIQPLGVPLVDTFPTAMNLTFNLDNHTHANYIHQGSDVASGYLPGVNVFSKTNLSETSHVLRVDVHPGSVFLFDYLVYTQTQQSAANSNPSDYVTPLAHNLPVPSETVSASTKRHNVGTFAGAVGGSVGVLAILSLGLAFSIIKRRKNYECRERLNRATLHTSGSGDSPPMGGPAPFVPRFFPGTQISSDPPPYDDESLSSPGSTPSAGESDASHPGTPDMTVVSSVVVPASYSAHLELARQDTSYADVPPASPSPPLDDLLSPPPSFGLAIASKPPGQ